MRALVAAGAALVGAGGLVVAVAVLLGLGTTRELPVALVVLGAVWVGLLPGLGLAQLLGGGRAAFGLGGGLWGLGLLLGLPLYLPGERANALAAGFGWLGAPLGPDAAQRMAGLGEALAQALGEEQLQGQPPPEPAESTPIAPAEPAPPALTAPAIQVGEQDEIALPYEGTGRSVRIPVVLEGAATLERWMLFDTGATYTTLGVDTLRALGVEVPRDAPEITLQTANGERSARVALVPRLWLGGFEVEGVTVAVCEECGGDDNAGLLGLNVSGQFTVTLDHGQQELILRPREGVLDRSLDISQWVDIEALATAWADGRVVVEVSAHNRSPRAVRGLAVGILCGEERFKAAVGEVPPGEERSRKVSLPRGTSCESYQIRLDSATW